jgi:hypothetical protein
MFLGKVRVKSGLERGDFYASNIILSEKLPFILKNKALFFGIKKEKMVNSSLIFRGKKVGIVLGIQYVSFKKCINIIESLKDKRITFILFPKNAHFIFESDSMHVRC